MNLYEVLNVKKDASIEEIKISYRKLAKKYHPDTSELSLDESKLKFDEIQKAYEILSDDDKRSNYDNSLNESIISNKNEVFSCNLKISIIDAWNGFNNKYSVTSNKTNKKYLFKLQWDRKRLYWNLNKSYNTVDNKLFIVKYSFTFVNYESKDYSIKLDKNGNLNVIVRGTSEKFPLDDISFNKDELPLSLNGFNGNRTIKIENEIKNVKLGFQPIVVESDSLQKVINKGFTILIVILFIINYITNR